MTEQRFPTVIDPRIYAGPSPIHGLGLFTNRPIEKGEIIMRWGGVLIDQAAWDPQRYRPKCTTRFDESRLLTRPWDEPGDLCELVNHSCDANTGMLDAVTVVALRPIAAGEEVLTDFALWSDDDYVYTADCRCGSPFCRKVITGKDWQLPAAQARYEGFFIPLLRERIDRQSRLP